jgi:ABC-type uncharacterized transport system substrate-binding protein
MMKRRDFITLFGGAAAWPLTVRAQQSAPANGPLVGFLNSASSETYRFNADSFREGLAAAGFVEGRNVRIEERWANGEYSALPALAAELVAKGVVVIAATGDVASARAAQGASSTVPVVFSKPHGTYPSTARTAPFAPTVLLLRALDRLDVVHAAAIPLRAEPAATRCGEMVE